MTSTQQFKQFLSLIGLVFIVALLLPAAPTLANAAPVFSAGQVAASFQQDKCPVGTDENSGTEVEYYSNLFNKLVLQWRIKNKLLKNRYNDNGEIMRLGSWINVAVALVDITGLPIATDLANGKKKLPAYYSKLINVTVNDQPKQLLLVIAENESGFAHSEDRILMFRNQPLGIDFLGEDGHRLLALYSERQPCPGCACILPKGAQVTWSIPREVPQGKALKLEVEIELKRKEAQNEPNVVRLDNAHQSPEFPALATKLAEQAELSEQATPSAELPVFGEGGKGPLSDCQDGSAAKPELGSLAYYTHALRYPIDFGTSAAHGLRYAAYAAPRTGFQRFEAGRTLARQASDCLGGIDFSTLELRYLADAGPTTDQALRYAFTAAPTTGDPNLDAGRTAAVQASDAFFVWLTLSPDKFWVNLKPNEPDRIIDEQFGTTDAGRILLQADLLLKKTVAQLIHPDTPLGQQFWQQLSRDDAPACFSFRQWIVPAPATIREDGDGIYILDAPLKVELESEYFELQGLSDMATSCPTQDQSTEDYNESVLRTLILPRVEQAVNEAPEYADLRRVYLSRVAAEWYRQRSANQATTYSGLVNHGDVSAWPARQAWSPREVFDQYVDSFTNHEFNVTQERQEGDAILTTTYVFGGVDFTSVSFNQLNSTDFQATWGDLPQVVETSMSAPVADDQGNIWLGGSAAASPAALATVAPTATMTATVTATATTSPTTTTSPTATTPSNTLSIRSANGYQDGTTLYVVGELLNDTTTDWYFTKVSAQFYDAANQLVASEDTYAYFNSVAPGQRNFFKLSLLNAPEAIDHYELSLEANPSGMSEYQPLTLLNQQTRDNGATEVFGEIKNDQPREMRNINVIVAFYDAAGQIIDAKLGYPSSTTLAPGQTAPYRIHMLENNLAFDQYEVFAQGELLDSTTPPTPPVDVRVRSERSYDQDTSRYIVGEIVNEAAQPAYSVMVAAKYYDAADQLVAVADAAAYLSSTQPNQRNPFKVALTNPPTTAVRYELSVFGSPTSSLDYHPLTVVSQQTHDNLGVEVLGEVQNDQAQAVQGVRVAVTFYDEADNVLETASGFPDSTTLASGQTATYQIRTFNEELIFASFTVQSEGYLAP